MDHRDLARYEAATRKAHTAVVHAPCPFKAGDAVHYAFNGDYYPGTVAKVSASGHQVLVNDAGELKLFTRRANGAYRSAGHGTWRLGLGHRDERNPSF